AMREHRAMRVTTGARPVWRSTLTRPTLSNAVSPRHADERLIPMDRKRVIAKRMVPVRSIPARCQMAMPTCSAFPGRAIAFVTQSHGIGPLRNGSPRPCRGGLVRGSDGDLDGSPRRRNRERSKVLELFTLRGLLWKG